MSSEENVVEPQQPVAVAEVSSDKPVAKRATKVSAPAAEAAPAGDASEPEAAPKPKRTRTRKPKADAAASGEAPVEASDGTSEATPAPKKRAPRKKKVAEADAPAEAKVAEVAAQADAEASGDSAGKPAPEASPAASVPAEGEVQAAPKPKRTRTRKPKADAEASGEAPADSDVKQALEKDAPAQEGSDQGEAKSSDESGDKADAKADGKASGKAGSKSEDKADAKSGDSGKSGSQKRRENNRDRENGKDRDRRESRNQRRKRGRDRDRDRREPAVPQTKKEDLAALKVAELRQKAAELEIDTKGLLKADLVEAVYAALVKKEGFQDVEGVLDVMPDGYGFLRSKGYLPGEKDAYLNASMIRRNGLRKGDYVVGQARPVRPNEKFPALQRISTVNGTPVEELGKRVKFSELTPVFPDERLVMEHGKNTITARVIDLTAPIGKGQRGLIVSPPKAGKTTILKDIAAAISANNPEVHLMCLLVDERPEEVTDMERSVKGEVIASTFDMPAENHIAVAEMVIERAKRLVENGEDVVILLDSITRLARAYNLAQPASGRILSGGVDSTALYPPKRFLGAARNIENGGSLTILASALIDTGSKMDEVIFEEFKGTGNMELKLDRYLADRRIFPAIDAVASGTRKEDLLMDPQEAPLIWGVRRVLANLNNTERATDMLIKSLRKTDTNQEFLIRMAKKMQGRVGDEISEL